MEDAVVRAVAVSKTFRSVAALREVSLHVAAGEIVVMLGRNGAGKSTLLRILGTRVQHDSGSVTVAGYDAARDPREVRRATGVVLQDERSWYWPLSGRANLEFFGRLSELSRRRARERSAELLEMMDLGDVADRQVATYSSGMRSRLAVARALLCDPGVLLLDEPSRALDPGAAEQLRALVLSQTRSRGSAVLWVTHDLHEAAVVGDRVVVLEGGRMRPDVSGRPGSAEELARLLAGRGPTC